MKAIKSSIIINSIRSRRDGSLGFSAETPELSSEEKVAFMDLQGKNLVGILSPADETEAEMMEIESDLEQKSQAKRLRGIIYVYCKKKDVPNKANDVYFNEMEKLIDKYKELVEEME